MTNQMKKRPNARVSKDVPFPSSSASDPDMPTLEELQARNEELERRLRKYKDKQKSARDAITPILRPKGEAGSRKRGFILYTAMGMDKVENGPVVYDRMRDSVRKACIKVGLNLGAHYKHQDHEKLGQVFHLVRKSYPYLTTARFPHNWAIAEMVKGYIAGTRKEHNRLAREARDEGEQSGGGDSEKENNPSNDDHPPPLKKKKTAHSSSSKSITSSADSFVDEQNDHDSRPPARPRHKQMTTTTSTTSKKRPPPISESNEITEEDDDQGLYEDD